MNRYNALAGLIPAGKTMKRGDNASAFRCVLQNLYPLKGAIGKNSRRVNENSSVEPDGPRLDVLQVPGNSFLE